MCSGKNEKLVNHGTGRKVCHILCFYKLLSGKVGKFLTGFQSESDLSGTLEDSSRVH